VAENQDLNQWLTFEKESKQRDVEKLRDDNRRLEEDKQMLEEEKEKLSQEKQKLETEIEYLQDVNKSLEIQNSQLTETNHKMQRTNSDLNQQINVCIGSKLQRVPAVLLLLQAAEPGPRSNSLSSLTTAPSAPVMHPGIAIKKLW
jgi:chromosome segregation ATPase